MNGMEQGLAAQAGQQGSMDQMLQEVVAMLMQGADPEELVQQGIPMEVVRQAVEIVLAQEQQGAMQQQPAQTGAGLAMTAAGGM